MKVLVGVTEQITSIQSKHALLLLSVELGLWKLVLKPMFLGTIVFSVHVLHHLAFIRFGFEEMGVVPLVKDDFWVAYCTIRYKEKFAKG